MESYCKEERLQKALKYLNVHVAMKVVHYMKRKTNIPLRRYVPRHPCLRGTKKTENYVLVI